MKAITMMQAQRCTKSANGASLYFECCKGGVFSADEAYALKLQAKNGAVATGTKLFAYGKNLLNHLHSETAGSIEYTFDPKSGSLHMHGDFSNRVLYLASEKMPVIAGSTVTANPIGFADKGAVLYQLRYYDKNGVWSYGSDEYHFPARICADLVSLRTVTIPSDVYYMDVCIVINRADSARPIDLTFLPQVEYGSVSTPYEPYAYGGTAELPIRLGVGDVWYPTLGRAVVFGREQVLPMQKIIAPQGTVQVVQVPMEEAAELSATVLVRR